MAERDEKPRRVHVFELQDFDGGGTGGVVTGLGGPGHRAMDVESSLQTSGVVSLRTPVGMAVIDYGPQHTQMVNEGGPANGQV